MNVTFISRRAEINPGDTSTYNLKGEDEATIIEIFKTKI